MSKGVYINLLPPEVQKKRTAEKGLFFLAAGVGLFIIFLIFISFAFGLKVKQEQAALDKLKVQTAKLDKEISKYNVFKDRKKEIAKHEEAASKAIENQLFWHRFLNELSMIVPLDVSINKLELKNDSISMSGSSFTHQGVAEFLVRMSDLDELKDIWIDGSKDTSLEQVTVLGESSSSSSSTSAESSTISGVEFTLTAKLKNPGPAAAGASAASGSSSGSSSSSSSSSGNQSSSGD